MQRHAKVTCRGVPDVMLMDNRAKTEPWETGREEEIFMGSLGLDHTVARQNGGDPSIRETDACRGVMKLATK